MKILITGNMGYVGPVLTRHLRQTIPNSHIIGYDNAYFGHCLTNCSVLPESRVDEQIFGDVRNIKDETLAGINALVLLAAISNDPIGEKFEDVTQEINCLANVELTKRALSLGVEFVVFASSCSIYGASDASARRESDRVSPLTAYARSKVATEQALSSLELGEATVTSLRFATACGMSDRLRLDLVLNDFVASAIASQEIMILSDGSPWRPLIDVADMARAIEWAMTRDPKAAGHYLAVNVGSNDRNYQIKDVAAAVAEEIQGTSVSINKNALPDKRSYKVDFSLFKEIAPRHIPQVDLKQSVNQVRDGLLQMGFDNKEFRTSEFMRLKILENHIDHSRIDHRLNWLKL